MHLLIPYVPIVDHVDPDLREFTYGDHGARARKLKKDLTAGDFVFFHTTIKNKKYITGYFVVDRVIDTQTAVQDATITNKYMNPHLTKFMDEKQRVNGDDAVLFGDPIRSYTLDKPLLFDKSLSNKLSLGIEFIATRSETQVIGSATRAWRPLTDHDVKILLRAVKTDKNKSCLKLNRSTEEVSQTLERDIEDHIANSPNIIGKNLKLIDRQLQVPSGRIDLLLADHDGNKTIIEIKLGRAGRDALNQIRRYIRDLRNDKHKVSGVIVCEGVLPAHEEELRNNKSDVQIMIYGWNLDVWQW